MFSRRDDDVTWDGPRWDHTVRFFRSTHPNGREKSPDEFRLFASELGDDGWEAVGFTVDDGNWTVLLKRPVADQA
jgi:hypothetical protein